MTPSLLSAVMPLLRSLEPEQAHRLALLALRKGLIRAAPSGDGEIFQTEALGLRLSNPIGLAAGFDKDAVAITGLAKLGFGFIELGTVTPRPQPGNPRPRLFRLTQDAAVINRMGFNGQGQDAFLSHLRAARPLPIPIGANLGINKEDADPIRDYPLLLSAVSPFVQYAVLNVSSPNTPGLRDLQSEHRLKELLDAIRAAVPVHPPLLVKLAPDLSQDALAALIETCIAGGIQGLIISNTTLSRPATLRSPLGREAGGLSGAPLFQLSTAILARARRLAGDRLCLIGVGGIRTGTDMLTKIQAGASLVQIYTAFAYSGPTLIPRIKRELEQALTNSGFRNLKAAVGTRANELSRMPE